jgi:hypothetical protein
VSLQVELERLLEVASGFGTTPMLLTGDADGRPRCAAVEVRWDGEIAYVRAGHRSVANAAQRPLVSLLWPAPPGERFALLVDGDALGARPDPPREDGRKVGGEVTVRVTSAILHVTTRRGH